MKMPLNVLIFPGGTEIGLELREALAWHKEVVLFSAGAKVSSHAPFAFANHDVIPSIHEERWCDALNELIERRHIDFIFPAHDDVLLALSENTHRIKCRVVASPLETCRVARSKRATYQRLAGAIPVPKVFGSAAEVTSYPVFLKPDKGQGSQDIEIVHSASSLSRALENKPNRIILEYLPGEEFTVDCFSDRDQGLLYCLPRLRERTRSGIAMASRPVALPEARSLAEAIAARLVFHGAWFFQLKRNANHDLVLLEVAPRVAGTSAVSRLLGVNLPLLSLYEAQRQPYAVRPVLSSLRLDRALVCRCLTDIRYRHVYVDLDDTLVVRGLVNPDLVKFLFQCLNRGVRLHLITRHEADLEEFLARHRLGGIFDEITKLGPTERKSTVIRERDAIFIDDSFRERQEVAEDTGIPGFDVSMLRALLDERV